LWGQAGSFDLPQHLQPSGFESVEVVARPLLGQRTVEDRDIAAAVTVAPLDKLMAAALAIGVDAHLARPSIVARPVGVVETLAALKAGDAGPNGTGLGG